MPYFDSPSLFIDFSNLPAPEVIETVSFEAILSSYKSQVLARNPALAAALALEQSPTNVILEVQSYGEMMVRARVNAAARAVMLPFATKNDLDVLGALYNVFRAVNADGSPELDTRYRRRIQLAPEAFATTGTSGAYIFQALTSDASIRDASAIKVNETGGVKVTLMNSGSGDPTPTPSQITNATLWLQKPGIKVLTDVAKVSAPTVFARDIVGVVTLYPGPDAGVVLNTIQTNVVALRSRLSQLGRSLTRSALITAMSPEGVESVDLKSPAADTPCNDDQCVWIKTGVVTAAPNRRT